MDAGTVSAPISRTMWLSSSASFRDDAGGMRWSAAMSRA
jgi:hypothetical protein